MITVVLSGWILVYIVIFAVVKLSLDIYLAYLNYKMRKIESKAKVLKDLSARYSDHA